MPKTILYPGTFDPIHFGHLELIQRISMQYDRVIVGVAVNCDPKKPCLSVSDRLHLTSQAVSEIGLINVEVMIMDSFFPVFAKKQGASAVLRGIRNQEDIGQETMMTTIARSPIGSGFFGQPIDVICMLTPDTKDISSTLIRRKIKAGEDVSDLVPDAALNYLAKYRDGIDDSHLVSQPSSRGMQLTHQGLLFWNKYKYHLAAAATGFVVAQTCSIQ